MAMNLFAVQFRHPGGAGYSLYAYVIGATTTPIPTYADYEGTSENAWPVVLADDGDGNGVATIFFDEDATIELQDTDDVTVTGYPADVTLPARRTEVDAALDIIDGRLAQLESDVSALQSDLSAFILTTESDISNLQGDVSSLNGTVGDIQVDLNAAESDISGLSGSVDSINGELDGTQSDVSSLTGTVDSMQDDITAIEGQLSALSWLEQPTGTATSYYDPVTDTLIQWGTSSSDSNGDASITFTTAYTTEPKVFLSGESSSFDAIGHKTVSVTTAGFSAKFVRMIASGDSIAVAAVSFYWIAIGKK